MQKLKLNKKGNISSETENPSEIQKAILDDKEVVDTSTNSFVNIVPSLWILPIVKYVEVGMIMRNFQIISTNSEVNWALSL